MRCYFHLVSRHDVILDNIGVEVADLESAEAEARQAIRDLRQEDDQTDEEWQGWQLNVTDAAGQLLVSIPLDTSLQ
jgi:FtsZ-binding cell division protein ZapB